jgi:chromosome segregation ATPase
MIFAIFLTEVIMGVIGTILVIRKIKKIVIEREYYNLKLQETLNLLSDYRQKNEDIFNKLNSLEANYENLANDYESSLKVIECLNKDTVSWADSWSKEHQAALKADEQNKKLKNAIKRLKRKE